MRLLMILLIDLIGNLSHDVIAVCQTTKAAILLATNTL